MEEQKHILDTLKQVRDAVQSKDYIKIKQLSNKFVHHCSIQQDADIISVAVIIYSLSKMLEREDYRKEKNWKQFYNDYLRTIKNMVIALAKINKASKIYEHGISMEKTAKILGITLWELAEYSGRTGIGNVNLGVTMQLDDRIKLAEEIFR